MNARERFNAIVDLLSMLDKRLSFVEEGIRRIEQTMATDWLREVNGADYEDWLSEGEDDCQGQKKE